MSSHFRAPSAGIVPRVLVAADHYVPGYKGGGPIRTISNLVERLGTEIRFHVATRDRDLGSAVPYENVAPCRWHAVGHAQVYYFPGEPSLVDWVDLLRGNDFDVLYLNSFFSYRFTILPLLALRRSGIASHVRVVLAPRGEFSPGAIALKRTKKKLFVWAARLLGLYNDVVWQASNEMEAGHIRGWFGAAADVRIASNLPSPVGPAPGLEGRGGKVEGRLRVAFLSRIARKKNLDAALRILARVRATIDFSIYGPREDMEYWAECERLIDALPDHVQVEYKGSVPNDQVRAVLGENHVFLFPTRGENYGHVIAEALASGCCLVISDQTPWRNLEERGIGWDLPLNDEGAWVAVLERCVAMDAESFRSVSLRANRLGREMSVASEAVEANRSLFASRGQRTRTLGIAVASRDGGGGR
jgi:glycosyltransferase involved in cell wall biosynthesis